MSKADRKNTFTGVYIYSLVCPFARKVMGPHLIVPGLDPGSYVRALEMAAEISCDDHWRHTLGWWSLRGSAGHEVGVCFGRELDRTIAVKGFYLQGSYLTRTHPEYNPRFRAPATIQAFSNEIKIDDDEYLKIFTDTVTTYLPVSMSRSHREEIACNLGTISGSVSVGFTKPGGGYRVAPSEGAVKEINRILRMYTSELQPVYDTFGSLPVELPASEPEPSTAEMLDS